jgi:hypothetical protein
VILAPYRGKVLFTVFFNRHRRDEFMKFHFATVLSLAAFCGIAAGVANAQTTTQTTTTQTTTYNDTACGTWNGDTWVPNGTCGDPTLHRHERVAGTITSVKGHLVTVQQTERTLVVDDTPALNNQLSGKVAVGRRIIAHGYWNNGTFYATLLTTADANATNQ